MSGIGEWVRNANRRREPEESGPLRVVVGVAVVASATAVLREGVGGPALVAAVVVGLPLAFVYSAATRHRSGLVLKVVLAAGVVIAFASFVSQILSGVAGPGSVQTPLAELFLWVQLLHAFDVPARRDLLFSLASSLVLVAMAAVFSTSMALGLHVAVWFPATVAALVLAYRSRLGGPGSLALAPGTPGTPGTSGTSGTVGVPRRPILVACAASLAAASVVFMALPQVSGRGASFPAQLPLRVPLPDPAGLSNPGFDDHGAATDTASDLGAASALGYFGFSRSLDTSVRGRPGDAVVMRVRAARPDFWRGQTFDTWDGRNWTQSEEEASARRIHGAAPLDVPLRPGDGYAAPGDELVQTFMLEESTPNLVFGAYDVRRVQFPDDTLFQMSDGTLRTGVALGRGAVYTVVSSRPAVSAAALRGSDEWYRSLVGRDRAAVLPVALNQRYTALPSEFPASLRALSDEITAPAPTVYDKVLAIEAWLAANTEYSLDAPRPPAGTDAAEAFLLQDRLGFCEQIGTALVLLLRAQGIPARLVAGYAPGERNPFTGLFEVKASDAHAWAEVYFPGVGWQGFDPTAVVPLASDAGASTGAALWSWLARRLPRWPAAAWAALAVALVLCGAASWWWSRRRRRRAATPPTWARRQAEVIEQIGARAGRARAPNEALATYARSLGDPTVAVEADSVERDAFGGGLTREQRRSTEAVLAAAARRAERQ